MRLREIVGQASTKQLLTQLVSQDRLPQALLLSGASGVGKLPLALAIAQYLMCEQPTPEDACGNCPSCLKHQKWVHPDVHFVLPVNTTKSVKDKPQTDAFLSDWRSLLEEESYPTLSNWLQHIGIENKQGLISARESQAIISKVSLKPYESAVKVVIIWRAEMMNASAANKLLKVLEEPPAGTHFLLTTEQSSALLPTVISRCQRWHIPPIEQNEIQQQLVQQMAVPADQAGFIASRAEGSFAAAKQLLEWGASAESFDAFQQWMRFCYAGDVVQLVQWCEQQAKMGRETLKLFLAQALEMIRLCLLHGEGCPSLMRVDQDQRAFIEKLSPFLRPEVAAPMAQSVEQAAYHISRNGNAKLILMDLSVQLAGLFRKKQAA